MFTQGPRFLLTPACVLRQNSATLKFVANGKESTSPNTSVPYAYTQCYDIILKSYIHVFGPNFAEPVKKKVN